MQGKLWLEPLVPSTGYPAELLSIADELPYLAGKLAGQIAPATAKRLGHLMRVTNSYYSNLIEGQYSEPAELASRSTRRAPKELRELAATHILVQESLERLLARNPDISWETFFSVPMLELIHGRLFDNASPEDLRLGDGRLLVPGQLRSIAQQNVVVGDHYAPGWESVASMLKRLEEVYGGARDPRTQLLCCLAFHHRGAFVHPFEDGNGRLMRMMTHLQLSKLSLGSPLWSISRGLARRQDEYYGRLRAADQSRRGDLDGRGQLSQGALIEFVGFMLEVIKDQILYVTQAMEPKNLREELERVVRFEPKFREAGIKPEAARALHLLLIQGEVTRADFKVYLGLHERTAIDQLKGLIELGVVEAPSPKSRVIFPGIPVWFAQMIFPRLHQRFS